MLAQQETWQAQAAPFSAQVKHGMHVAGQHITGRGGVRVMAERQIAHLMRLIDHADPQRGGRVARMRIVVAAHHRQSHGRMARAPGLHGGHGGGPMRGARVQKSPRKTISSQA